MRLPKHCFISAAEEGMDAAGKGSNIRRLVQTLDPRGYEVLPTGPPLSRAIQNIMQGKSAEDYN